MSRRITFSLILVTLVVTALITAATYLAVRSALETDLRELALDRAHQTAAIFEAAGRFPVADEDPVGSLEKLRLAREVADHASEESDAHLVLVGSDGTVIAHSLETEDSVSSLLANAELARALPTTVRPGIGPAVTHLGDRIYAAVPLSESTTPWSNGSLVVGIPDSTLAGGRNRSWLIPLIVGIVLVAPSALLARRITQTLRESLSHLGTMAERLGEGDLSYRVGTQRTDELGDLGRTFNTAADQLQTRIESLADAQEQARRVLSAMTDGVIVLDEQGRVRNANLAAARILETDRSTLESRPIVHTVRAFPAVSLMERALARNQPVVEQVELPGGRHILAQAIPLSSIPGRQRQTLVVFRDDTERIRTERMRRDFVTNVSHELKTPLSGLSLLAETLQEAVREDPESARSFAERLSTELDRLNDLADDLLTLSRLEETRALEFAHPEPLDLAALANEVVDDMRGRAEEGRQDLDIAADIPTPVRGDPVELETMIRNLLDNALRYTDPGGQIAVKVIKEPEATDHEFPYGRAYVEVSDTGIGIPRDDLDRIFERFYRVDKARSRETGGTGLGLSIVRHIAERHGGSVQVRSTVGVGSTFTVTLPLAIVP